MLSGRGVCDELITRPEESYLLCCVVVCDLETSRMGAPYIYDISRLRVKSSKRIFFLILCVFKLSFLYSNYSMTFPCTVFYFNKYLNLQDHE